MAKGQAEATRSILIHLDLVNEAATPKVIPRIRIHSDWEKGILPSTISDWENDLTGKYVSNLTNGSLICSSHVLYSRGRFAFGLGKRNLKEDDLDQWLNDEEYLQFDDTEDEIEDKEEDSQEVMDINKRSQITTGQQQQQAFFPSHLQSAFYGGAILPNMGKMNHRIIAGLGKSRTINQQAGSTNDLPNLGKRLPVYNFGLGK